MVCNGCNEDVPFIHKQHCLSCLWRKGTPTGLMFVNCVNCGVLKPSDMFKGKDRTCSLCRRLISVTRTRYSHKLDISKELMIEPGGVCISCGNSYPLDAFPKNSFDCIYCWGARSLVEVVKVCGQFDFQQACRVCGVVSLASSFPMGRLTCRSCINRENGKSRI